MRRFLLCAVLLLVLLALTRRSASMAGPLEPSIPLLARVTTDAGSPSFVAEGWDWNWEWDGEGLDRHRVREEFFGHPSPPRQRPPTWRSALSPREEGGEIRFRLADHGYRSVALSGSFDDYEEIAMELDPQEGWWEIRRPLERGRHRYVFVVVDGEGRRRERSDPSNPRRVHHERRRRVSVLVVDRQGEVVEPWSGDEGRLDLLGDVGAGYQRVDGLSLCLRPTVESSRPFAPSLMGEVGYGFSSQRWSLRMTLLQPLVPGGELRLALSAYDRTAFVDRTGVGDLENSLSTLLFREDNRDYHRLEGVSVGLETLAGDWMMAQMELRSDDYRSLELQAHAGWGGRERLAPNPAVDEGVLRSLAGRVRLGTELNHLQLEGELSHDRLFSTAHEFAQITGRVRSRLRMGRHHYLDLRLMAGTWLDGTLPVQRQYVLGGIGTVRGYPYQSLLRPAEDRPAGAALPLGGQRMALANVEYAFGVEDDLLLVLFFDTGMAWEDRDASMDPQELQSSVGLGIATGPGDDLRLDLIKTLDHADSDILVQARVRRMF